MRLDKISRPIIMSEREVQINLEIGKTTESRMALHIACPRGNRRSGVSCRV